MKRIIVGITGASGAIYGIRILEILSQTPQVETHLVITDAGALTIQEETNWTLERAVGLAHHAYEISDIGAAISSGSFKNDGMIVAPCSIKTMAMISNSINSNLIIRAADVTLKEKRKLVLLIRETPLHLGHLRLMVHLAEIGAVICPPVPSFYHKPNTVDDVVNQTVGKVLDQFEIDHSLFKRWSGMEKNQIQLKRKPSKKGRRRLYK